jgi:hypothetical protein
MYRCCRSCVCSAANGECVSWTAPNVIAAGAAVAACGAECGLPDLAAGMPHGHDAHAAAPAHPAALQSRELQSTGQAGPQSSHRQAAGQSSTTQKVECNCHTCFNELANKHLGNAAHDDRHVKVDLLPHNRLLQLHQTHERSQTFPWSPCSRLMEATQHSAWALAGVNSLASYCVWPTKISGTLRIC